MAVNSNELLKKVAFQNLTNRRKGLDIKQKKSSKQQPKKAKSVCATVLEAKFRLKFFFFGLFRPQSDLGCESGLAQVQEQIFKIFFVTMVRVRICTVSTLNSQIKIDRTLGITRE